MWFVLTLMESGGLLLPSREESPSFLPDFTDNALSGLGLEGWGVGQDCSYSLARVAVQAPTRPQVQVRPGLCVVLGCSSVVIG